MKDDKEELQSDIWEELRNLRYVFTEQRAELERLTERVTAADRLAQALQEEITAQAAELAVIQQTVSTVQESVSDNLDHLVELQLQQEGKVAFSTSLYKTGEGITHHSIFATLVFKNVFTNYGNHYNSISGHFTAPFGGVYYFRFTGHTAHATDSMVLKLVKNEEPIVCSGDRRTTATDPEDNAANGAVLQLQTGDLVSIQMVGMVWDDQYHRTTFSGFLLFAL
ncbi:complement C1q and tumor necrosis factor-related protein 9A [Austrofundulus limnaeus]|uniref:Complement C1q and tumor necrosis factor-related protein 9A n=1 Tax=Austrofundulus limnaeus TaxID=52670 RepID=A0A2I4CLR8_AUSLI|nr:PREDICTED: complement C1q and tumor necrosis factor-related protein 9A-like [Austrofundulus limnaeus]